MAATSMLIADAVACMGAAAQAAISTTTGTTSGAPTFERPVDKPCELSTIGTSVNCSGFSCSVSAPSRCSFLAAAGFESFAPYEPA